MEKLFLRAILAGEKLDVVDQQRIQRAVTALEFINPVVLQRPHHVADEAFRVDVSHARARVAGQDAVADGVHQVGLAEAHAAVQEQRVVRPAGVLRHLESAGPGELVALALDETVEGEVRVEARAAEKLAARRCGMLGWRRGAGNHFHAGPRHPRAHVDGDIQRLAAVVGCAGKFADPVQAVLPQPRHDIGVGRQQTQGITLADGLQGSDVGVELVRRQFVPEPVETLMPGGRHFASCASC